MTSASPSQSSSPKSDDQLGVDGTDHGSEPRPSRRVSDSGSLPPSNLDRLDPDSILADEADPDTLFNADSDSEYGSRRSSYAHASPAMASSAAQAPAPASSSPQHSAAHLDDTSGPAVMTPTQSTHDIAAIAHANGNGNGTDKTPVASTAAQIRSLRSQVEDLTNQVTGLNGKLVNSFMRISDLEDDLSDAKERVMTGSTRVAELEKERQEHLAALNTGLLVEKAHVSTEMQRMMDRVIEETKQRGQAESDKAKIESELDELSASLFNEANRMVAVEKLARARAEEKSKQMEERLQDTEGIMLEQQKVLADLQKQLDAYKAGASHDDQPTPANGESSESNNDAFHTADPLSTVSTRSMVGPMSPRPPVDQRLLLLDIVPYQELRAFLNHLRKLRKQLSPFYSFPYDPKRGPLAHKHSASTESPANGTPQRPSSPAVSHTLQSAASASSYGIHTDYNGQIQSNPFILAGIGRHKDYPTLPANCEQLVHLPSQLSLPFIKRAQEEDSDPCLRLDFAPGFNWLTRRTANTAILEGNLVIEPVFAGGVVRDEDAVRAEHAHLPPAACAMCGTLVVNVPLPGADEAAKGSGAPDLRSWASSMAAVTGSAASSLREAAGAAGNSSPSTLSASADSTDKPPLKSNRSGLFSSFASLRNMTGSPKPSKDATPQTPVTETAPSTEEHSSGASPVLPQPPTPTTPASARTPFPTPNGPLPVPTHIFRLSETATTRYLLCPHHCLGRLRAVCAFWGYLRNIERAVVLEGKLAWDDEQQQQQQHLSRNATIKPLPKIASAAASIEEVQPDSAADAPPPPVAEASQALKSAVESSDGEAPSEADGVKSAPDAPAEEDSEVANSKQPDADAEHPEDHTASNGAEPSRESGQNDPADSETARAEHERRASEASSHGTSLSEEGFQDAQSDAAQSPKEGEKTLPEENGGEGNTASENVSDDTNTTGADASGDDTTAPSEEATERLTVEPDAGTKTPLAEKPEAEATASSSSSSTSTSSALPPVPPRRQHRPVPALPAPPPVPPRSSVDAAATQTNGIAAVAAATLPPAKKRLSLDTDTSSVSWEEKVYLEVVKLKRDMWEARAGIVD